MQGLSQRRFAEHAGVSRQAVGRALERGRLVRDERGKIDPNDAVNAAWAAQHVRGFDDLARPFHPVTPGDRNSPRSFTEAQLAGPPPRALTDAEIDALIAMPLADPSVLTVADDGNGEWGDEVVIDARKADRLLRRCFAEGAHPISFLVAGLEYLRDRLEKLEERVAQLTG